MPSRNEGQFIWLVKRLEIPWYVMADGEEKPISDLEAALKKAGCPPIADSSNVVTVAKGNNFETQLLADGYLAEVEVALNETYGQQKYLDWYIDNHHGLPLGKNNVLNVPASAA